MGAGPLANADLAIIKSDAPDPVPVRGNVVYTINVDNDGPNAATVEITASPTTAGTLTDAAAVSADQNDPDPADNSTTEDTTVSGSVDGAVPIPTAGTWALLALALGLAGLGVRRLV